MANLGGTFDANQVEPNAPYEVIPEGEYRIQITNSSMENTKDNTGQYLKLELEIMEGQQAGRKLFDRLNLVNRNQQAMEIAQRTLSAICHAVGVLTVNDSEQLHMRPMLAKVKVVDRKDRPGEKSNEIGSYKAAGAGAPSNPAPQQNQQRSGFTPSGSGAAPGSAGGTSTPPWKRSAA